MKKIMKTKKIQILVIILLIIIAVVIVKVEFLSECPKNR